METGQKIVINAADTAWMLAATALVGLRVDREHETQRLDFATIAKPAIT
jgi:hypothetical protein